MSYVVFKLNIQPDILVNYKGHNDIEYLLFEMIPSAFESVMQIEKNNDIFELVYGSADEHVFSTLYSNLEEKTTELFKSYQQILLRYKKKQDIHYSEGFLKLNEKCMRERRSIEKSYPGIIKAYKLISDEEIDKQFKIESDSKVGTGITHLRKFYKIKAYLEKYGEHKIINPLNLKAYYNPETEHVLVKSQSETAAQNYVTALVKLLNESTFSNEHIGKVNINPIYESISLPEEYSEISYVIVYPNGNPPLDRHNILKHSEAKEIRSVLVSADGKPLKSEPIENMLENEAKKGYLKSLKAKGGKIYKRLKRIEKINSTS